ncbi:MAG: hypothetical protein R3E88_00585 [Myxococcota bacterium]|nr:hypothetical protein [Myxococcales bacterium]
MPEPALRRVRARFYDAEPVDGPGGTGVWLRFRPERSRIVTEPIEHFADLGPEWCIPAVGGAGAVLRVLRAARVAAPADPKDLVADAERCGALLQRAIPSDVVLSLRPRSNVRFTAWTDDGVEVVEHVRHVLETERAWIVVRAPGLAPVLVERERVVRQQTECDRFWEVVDIERAP